MDLCHAINNRLVIHFVYKGLPRDVHPAAYGTHVNTGGLRLRGYQVSGGSTSGPLPGWRMFSVEKIGKLTISNQTFGTDPPGYYPGDQHLKVICEL